MPQVEVVGRERADHEPGAGELDRHVALPLREPDREHDHRHEVLEQHRVQHADPPGAGVPAEHREHHPADREERELGRDRPHLREAGDAGKAERDEQRRSDGKADRAGDQGEQRELERRPAAEALRPHGVSDPAHRTGEDEQVPDELPAPERERGIALGDHQHDARERHRHAAEREARRPPPVQPPVGDCGDRRLQRDDDRRVLRPRQREPAEHEHRRAGHADEAEHARRQPAAVVPQRSRPLAPDDERRQQQGPRPVPDRADVERVDGAERGLRDRELGAPDEDRDEGERGAGGEVGLHAGETTRPAEASPPREPWRRTPPAGSELARDDLVAAGLHRFGERLVGAAHEAVGRPVGGVVARGDAEGHRHRNLALPRGDRRLADTETHALGERRGVLHVATREEHQEFVGAEARDRIGAPHDAADAVGDLDQHAVAGGAAVLLDDALERVDLPEDHRDALAVAARAVELAVEQLEHRVAVPELRAGVDQRAAAQPLALLDELRLRAAERDELQLRLDQPREVAQQDQVTLGERVRHAVAHAEHAGDCAVGRDDERAGVEAHLQAAGHPRMVEEARVADGVGHDERAVALDRRRVERHLGPEHGGGDALRGEELDLPFLDERQRDDRYAEEAPGETRHDVQALGEQRRRRGLALLLRGRRLGPGSTWVRFGVADARRACWHHARRASKSPPAPGVSCGFVRLFGRAGCGRPGACTTAGRNDSRGSAGGAGAAVRLQPQRCTLCTGDAAPHRPRRAFAAVQSTSPHRVRCTRCPRRDRIGPIACTRYNPRPRRKHTTRRPR